MTQQSTFRDVIEALGGAVEASAKTNLPYGKVKAMHERNSINGRYFLKFAEACQQSGHAHIDCEFLSRIAADNASKNGAQG